MSDKPEQTTGAWRQHVEAHMGEANMRHIELKEQLDQIKKNTDDIVAFFVAGQGAFKFIKLIGTIAKWITSVGAAIALLWLLAKGIK